MPDAGSLLKERDKLLKEFPQLSYFLTVNIILEVFLVIVTLLFLKNAGFYQNLTKHYISVLYLNDLYYYSKSFTIAGILKKKGMAWIFISNKKENRLYSLNEEHLIRKEISNLSIIFHLNIFKSDCLTYSYALKRILNSRNIDAHLVIGVRTQPFIATLGWRLGGQVINDAPNMRDKLSVIAEI